MNRVLVLCEVQNCKYHILEKNEGKAYQNQCGNDEIEIGVNFEGKPECCSYEKEDDA